MVQYYIYYGSCGVPCVQMELKGTQGHKIQDLVFCKPPFIDNEADMQYNVCCDLCWLLWVAGCTRDPRLQETVPLPVITIAVGDSPNSISDLGYSHHDGTRVQCHL